MLAEHAVAPPLPFSHASTPPTSLRASLSHIICSPFHSHPPLPPPCGRYDEVDKLLTLDEESSKGKPKAAALKALEKAAELRCGSSRDGNLG